MSTILTPGRWRGLIETSDAQNLFTILAFDQRGSLTDMMPAGWTYADVVEVKREAASVFSQHASAMLLDPIYGLDAALALARGCGLIVALEKSGYSGDSTYRRIEFYPEWTVRKIKQMGGSAVKLLIYYHPHAGVLTEELETLVQNIAAECHAHDLPLFLEPVTYSLKTDIAKSSREFASELPALVRETAQRLSVYRPDVLKMEFPVDAKFDTDETLWASACAAISEVCDVPWVLLSAGVNFDVFEKQVRVACQQGASGFLAGRAIWKEGVPMPPEDRIRFMHEVGVARLQKLIDATHAHARPWTDFYTPTSATETWYADYAAQ
jgi:tagatose 1,6-diphosphate aldolase